MPGTSAGRTRSRTSTNGATRSPTRTGPRWVAAPPCASAPSGSAARRVGPWRDPSTAPSEPTSRRWWEGPLGDRVRLLVSTAYGAQNPGSCTASRLARDPQVRWPRRRGYGDRGPGPARRRRTAAPQGSRAVDRHRPDRVRDPRGQSEGSGPIADASGQDPLHPTWFRSLCVDADVRLTRNVPTPARVSVIEGAPA